MPSSGSTASPGCRPWPSRALLKDSKDYKDIKDRKDAKDKVGRQKKPVPGFSFKVFVSLASLMSLDFPLAPAHPGIGSGAFLR
jgi:hypothetical protein